METRAVAGGRRLRVRIGPAARECEPGASIAVSGVCLTVTDRDDTSTSFDVVAETLDKSTLGAKREGDVVNIELSLRLCDRVDGHFVQGHVDGIATVERIESSPKEHAVWLRPQDNLRAYIVPKGSIALDGVSLTIAKLEGALFSVALIPTTLERTTFRSLARGDRVNVETDIIARTVVHQIVRMSGAADLSMDTLRNAGFL